MFIPESVSFRSFGVITFIVTVSDVEALKQSSPSYSAFIVYVPDTDGFHSAVAFPSLPTFAVTFCMSVPSAFDIENTTWPVGILSCRPVTAALITTVSPGTCTSTVCVIFCCSVLSFISSMSIETLPFLSMSFAVSTALYCFSPAPAPVTANQLSYVTVLLLPSIVSVMLHL